MAIEDEYRAYREVLAAGIVTLRPGTEVTAAGIDRLEEELECLDPEVVICSRPEPTGSGVTVAWVELPLNPTRRAKISLGGRRFESTNPTLDTLLAIIDEAERIPRTPSAQSLENDPFKPHGSPFFGGQDFTP